MHGAIESAQGEGFLGAHHSQTSGESRTYPKHVCTKGLCVSAGKPANERSGNIWDDASRWAGGLPRDVPTWVNICWPKSAFVTHLRPSLTSLVIFRAFRMLSAAPVDHNKGDNIVFGPT